MNPIINIALAFKSALTLCAVIALTGCLGNMNPTGNNRAPKYPFYVTQTPITVKAIAVPVGTKLSYEESWNKSGPQNEPMSENKLIQIEFPKDKPILWGGMPTGMLIKYFNSEMRGMSVYPAEDSPIKAANTPFIRLWSQCRSNLGVNLRDTSDWSFNKANIQDIDSCSVVFQRYFKNDKTQQDFLDRMYRELQQISAQ
jgi:hypothetical protein